MNRAKPRPEATPRRLNGITLIELLVVLAVMAVVVTLTAPSFKRFTESQRVSSVNAQLVTDMQFARAEAAARGERVRVTFRTDDATLSCYSIYTYDDYRLACDCRNADPCAGRSPAYKEIKTSRFYMDRGVIAYPERTAQRPVEFAFEPLAGGLYTIPRDEAWDPLQSFTVRTYIDPQRALRTVISLSGRPTVCAPAGSEMKEQPC